MKTQLEKAKAAGDSARQHSTQSVIGPGPVLTVFEFNLQISGLDKVGLDGLKPPEKFGNKHHHVLLCADQ